jgi:hypothetical protein
LFETLRGFWVDERGSGETFSAIGIVIGMVVLAGIVVGIGITVGKTKMSGVAGDITEFKVYTGNGEEGSGAEINFEECADANVFGTRNGEHTLTGVEITDK